MAQSIGEKGPQRSRMTTVRVVAIIAGALAIVGIAGVLVWRNLYNNDSTRQFAFARFDTPREHQSGLLRLKREDPKAYLREIRLEQGDDAWLAQLAILDPTSYRVEAARRSQEGEAKRAAATAAQRNGADCIVSMSQYLTLRAGEAYSDVADALGCNGIEVSHAKIGQVDMVMYMWKGGFVANMNATFQNGRLVAKAQFGLQ